MNENVAVIDLGTNTFHIIIARSAKVPVGFEVIFRERQFVKLAEDGIEKIGKAPFERGLTALMRFKEIMDNYKVQQIQAVGTAALRTASNGAAFIAAAAKIGIPIQLIDGLREAELIGKGVKRAIPNFHEEKYLIMDIGGGSVEFIIADQQQVYWAESFPIGVAILYKRFQHSDPIQKSEIKALEDFLAPSMSRLKEMASNYKLQRLIGASGTFDVLENMIGEKVEGALCSTFTISQFWAIYPEILKTALEDRLKNQHIPEARAEMLPASLLLIANVIRTITLESVVVSAFALKEGLLGEMIN